MLLSAYLTDTVRKLKIWFVKSVGSYPSGVQLKVYYAGFVGCCMKTNHSDLAPPPKFNLTEKVAISP